MYWELSSIGKCRFGNMVAPGIVPSSWLLFPIHIHNNKLPYVLTSICDSFFNLQGVTWILLMSMLAKSAPILANSLVVGEFHTSIFQTCDVLVCYLLSDWKQKTDWLYAASQQLNTRWIKIALGDGNRKFK